MTKYDIITVGGGLGGAALAKAMAERGHRVLVLERETTFKDRVRGEWLAPWGVAEAKELGLYDPLVSAGGYHPLWHENRMGPASLGLRDLSATTPQGLHALTFYHPRAQEAALESAERAGAEVRRGARVTGVQSGGPASVSFEVDGRAETASARLVVGADGRGSMVRKWAGFELTQDPDQLFLAGLLFEGLQSPEDTSVLVFNPFQCRNALIFPQGGGRARCYFGAHTANEARLQGEKDIPRFIQLSVEAGLPAEYFANAQPQGPLATFPGADSWVDHPYHDGVALVGDAASHGDQTWGQGMSMTFRDVRLLRDALLTGDDWDRAGHAYAAAQHEQFDALHRIEDWFTKLFMDPSAEAATARMKALPRIAQDGSRIHDGFVCGPDSAPTDEPARRRFFGEE